MIPPPATCMALMERYGMLPHIRRHSLLVGRVADLLARRLADAGLPVSVEAAVAGGLLHDIAKTPCLDGRCDHAAEGAKICRQHGFDELVPLVAEHVVLANGPPPPDRITAREVVYYADKRVDHDRIVDLDERRRSIIRRYANGDPARTAAIDRNFRICQDLEAAICGQAGIAPSDLARQVLSLPDPFASEAT